MSDFQSKVDALQAEADKIKAQQEEERIRKHQERQEAQRLLFQQKTQENEQILAELRSSVIYQRAIAESNSPRLAEALKILHSAIKPRVTEKKEVERRFLGLLWDRQTMWVERDVLFEITITETVHASHDPHSSREVKKNLPAPIRSITIELVMPLGKHYLIGSLEGKTIGHGNTLTVVYSTQAQSYVAGGYKVSYRDGENSDSYYVETNVYFSKLDELIDYIALLVVQNKTHD